MNPHTLRALEFDTIQEMLSARCGSPAARVRAERLAPELSVPAARAALARTAEARTVLEATGRQPYQDLPTLEPVLAATRAEGAELEPRALLDVATACALSSDIARAVARVEGIVGLAHLAGSVIDTHDLANAIHAKILPSGEVADHASPRLAEVRRSIERARASLQSVMDSFLRGKEAARVLQERLVATRNDRYVLILKAEHRGQISGIIHGSSSSGASLFVEPLPAVEINNDIVALADDERREVLRILRELSGQVRDRLGDIEHALEVMTTLDALQAQALLARDMAATCPEIVDELRLDLREARHPLLLAGLTEPLGLPRRATRDPVPVSIRIEPEAPVLVISGPNTGGKTVALKTAGLLALMAQCGLHIPAAEGSALPAFRSLFADIGDDQSIMADLSTFSAHLANVVEMTRALALPALVLLDEVGSGTEPAEGGALGVGIVDHFRERGAMVLASTHHGLMKTYAQTTPGVVCASFGYDPTTYAPTYRLSLGTPGRSLAIEMAERLGLPPQILATARARVDRREADLDELTRRLERERAELAKDVRRAAAERERLEEARRDQERLLAEIEERRREELSASVARLERRGQEALQRADDAVRQALQRLEATRGNALRAAARARREAREAFEAAQRETRAEGGIERPRAPSSGPLNAGDRVRIAALGGAVGSLLHAPEGDEAEVDVGGKRLRVPVVELTPLAATARARHARSGVSGAAKDAPAEINVIGLTVDEALPRVDKLLDDAILSDTTRLRVIHGHGAGKLRRAVRELLEGHPHVAAFHAGDTREGGSGVTIVDLRE